MPTTNVTTASSDRIEKQVTLDAPRSRVWRALTDVAQFNTWFGVSLATPFTPGAEVSGKISIPNYDHVTMTIWIETMEPERLFSFRWHPYAIEPGVDYSAEQFLTWFVKEQVEEVASMNDLLNVAERSRENPMLAEEFLSREQLGDQGADPTAPPAAGGTL